ncbi:MAG: 2-oxoacid:acceptor oxidoreductase subunit alpha [Candidatus Aenigmatarchaeota archaeon]
MEKIILIGGEAGQGIAKTSLLIGKALTRIGYYVFNYRDYPSLIQGGHNFNVIKISEKPVYSHENFYDVIIALDKKTIEKHKKNLRKDGFILADLDLKPDIGINIKQILEKLNLPAIMGNNILAGALFKILGFPLAPLLESAEKEFEKNAEAVKNAIKEGYNAVEQRAELHQERTTRKAYFLTGNEAIGAGAIAAGLDLYIAYPMTPATPVLHFLASKQSEYNILVVQLENEIACINAALGAGYAGAKAMVGTSGGGFALMTEAISLQGMTEIPLVVYLSQRTGPSTGAPTYTGQSDLKFAVNAGHGEFPKIVVAPGDAKEAFYRTIEAFYLAHKYRTLSIIIGDKHLGESNYTFEKFETPKIRPERFIVDEEKEYRSYLITETGVSPLMVPGQKQQVRVNSYEHNDYGFTTEDPEWIVKMNEKRLRKIKYIKKEIERLKPISVYGKGKKLIIGWGSTKGAILDALKGLDNFRFMQISYIMPFPSKEVKREIDSSEKVILVENNATGLLGQIIAEQVGIFIESKILKYDARPFTSHEIIDKIKSEKI